MALIRDAGGPELQVLTEPPFEFGWRTGREALLGEKRTVEEAAVIQRALWDANRASPNPAPPPPHVKKPAAPQPHVKQPGPSSSDADGMDLALDDLVPDDSENDLEDRLPLVWEKKIAAVDRKWFRGSRS